MTYMTLATRAAELEHDRHYEQAAEYWDQAYCHAGQLENLLWCRLRAEFCRHAWRWVARGIDCAA